eukprot:CAMPEP_0173170536 /NCGR_PEP_ID=MMETSP1141-20130122/1285_1 /TAXON_ID=483371 /ORGANISM="non described non described, Strain CCMP2298" /LENGTH=215 /DNA_ID=CAMNT_0014092427 /DNA_START=228 /DNA_END=875 /DNA_ORIENTATION=-
MTHAIRKQYSVSWARRHTGIIKAYREAQCEVCVEIGVARGELSHALLKHLPHIKEYHAVDPFVGGYDKGDQMSELLESMNGSIPWGQAVLYAQRGFGDKFRMHQGFSHDIVGHFPNNSVDCVFIDGDHTFKGAQLDIQLWTRVLKTGGRYFFDDYSTMFMGVVYAVDGFFDLNHIPLIQINKQNNYMGVKPAGPLILDYPCVCGGKNNENCRECK